MFGFGKRRARKRRERAVQSADAYIQETYFWEGIDAFKGKFDDEVLAAKTAEERAAIRHKIIDYFYTKDSK